MAAHRSSKHDYGASQRLVHAWEWKSKRAQECILGRNAAMYYCLAWCFDHTPKLVGLKSLHWRCWYAVPAPHACSHPTVLLGPEAPRGTRQPQGLLVSDVPACVQQAVGNFWEVPSRV